VQCVRVSSVCRSLSVRDNMSQWYSRGGARARSLPITHQQHEQAVDVEWVNVLQQWRGVHQWRGGSRGGALALTHQRHWIDACPLCRSRQTQTNPAPSSRRRRQHRPAMAQAHARQHVVDGRVSA
jgi:hypothetical protein